MTLTSGLKAPVVVDLFCGAGGESQGIHWALGDNIKLFAVNHWEIACNTHSHNFPMDECICQDIQTVNPRRLVPDGHVALLWASPECTHFSVARGGKPMDDQSRCTPFDILRWASMLTIDRIIIENVPEFQSWGILGEDDRPIESEKGKLFQSFVTMLASMGYTIDWRILNAADFGAPTSRRRFFLQAVKGGKRIVWPKQTHAKASELSDGLFEDERKPWVAAKEIIDWSLPCEAIDDRRKPLCEATMRRILNGIAKFWGKEAVPFLCRYNGGENRVHPITEPVPVLDTSNRYGLVQPLVVEMYGKSGCRPVTEPLSTIATSGAHHALVMEYYGNGVCHDPNTEPLPVVTTKERFALIERSHGVKLGFRMLQPHELAAAQSFPRSYNFLGNRSDVVKQIGNAVCPKMAHALVAAGTNPQGR